MNNRNNHIMLSIIIISYNMKDFIDTCLLSLKHLFNSNSVQIIFVNDGSTDNTIEILNKYSHVSNLIVVNTKNYGAGHARNTGISYAKGKWVSFLDCDDMYSCFSFSRKQLELLSQYSNDEVDVIYTPWVFSDMKLSKDAIIKPAVLDSLAFPTQFFAACLYRSEFIKRNKIMFYEYKIQDVETAFKFIVKHFARKIITEKKLSFYIHRDNLNSNTHTWFYSNLYGVKAMVYCDLLSKYLNKNNKKEIFYRIGDLFFSYFKSVSKNGISNSAVHTNTIKAFNDVFGFKTIITFLKAIGIKRTIFIMLHSRKKYKKSNVVLPKRSNIFIPFEDIEKNYIELSTLLRNNCI